MFYSQPYSESKADRIKYVRIFLILAALARYRNTNNVSRQYIGEVINRLNLELRLNIRYFLKIIQSNLKQMRRKYDTTIANREKMTLHVDVAEELTMVEANF